MYTGVYTFLDVSKQNRDDPFLYTLVAIIALFKTCYSTTNQWNN